jgi:hypothetical membrane protein
VQSVVGSSWAAATGAIIVFWVAVFVAGFLATPAYSHVDHALSTLGLADSPFGVVARSAFVVLGLANLLLAAYFRKVAAPLDVLARSIVILLVVHGVGRIGEGLFPPLEGAVTGTLHPVFGIPAVLAMPVLPFVFAAWARRSRRVQLSRVSLVFGVVFVVLMILGVAAQVFPLGLGQRAGFALWYVWLIWAFSPYSLQPAQSSE